MRSLPKSGSLSPRFGGGVLPKSEAGCGGVRSYVVIMLLCMGVAYPTAGADDLLHQFTTTGIVIDEQTAAVLPRPSLIDVNGNPLQGDQADAALKLIAGSHGDRFTRDSIVAPIDTRIESLKDAAGQTIGHRMRVTFVVHAPIDDFRDTQTLQSLIGDAGDDEDDLESTRAEKLDGDPLGLLEDESTFARVQFSLLGRVVVRGVTRVQRRSAEDGVRVAWIIDPRLSEADPPQNVWLPIERTATGQKRLGNPVAYRGAAGWLAITPLPGDDSASVVQSYLILCEPEGWFNGSRQLRSKLPLIVQDRVRDLRRRLVP